MKRMPFGQRHGSNRDGLEHRFVRCIGVALRRHMFGHVRHVHVPNHGGERSGSNHVVKYKKNRGKAVLVMSVTK